MAEATLALELDAVSSGYGETVIVENVHLALKPGEMLAIIGRNGVGKTTLVSTVMGHNTLHRGRTRVRGYSVSNFRQTGVWPRASAMCPRSARFFGR